MILLKNKDKKANIKIGNNIEIKDGSDFPFDLTLYGKSTQATRSGKNILALNLIQTQTINGITLTNLDNGTILVNGTATSSTIIDISYQQTLKANVEYKFINFNAYSTSNANINIKDSQDNTINAITLNLTNKTFTPNTDTEIAKMRFYIDSNQTFENYTLKVMLIKSSDNDSWEPYGVMPSPDFPSPIESIGRKNLFDKNNVKRIYGYIQNNTTWKYYNDSYSIRIPVKPNTNYVISADNSNETIFRAGVTDSSDIPVSGTDVALYSTTRYSNTNTPIYITTGANAKYIVIQVAEDSANDTFNTLQLEKGQATDYVPYEHTEISATVTGKNLFNKYGDFTYGSTNNRTSLQSDGTILSTSNFASTRSSGLLIGNIKSNTDYIISGILVSADGTNIANNAVIQVLTTSNTPIKDFYIKTSATKPCNFSFTFNSGENTSFWISLNGWNSTGEGTTNTIFDNIQLEEGTVTAEYEEYKSNSLTIDLQGNELCSLPNGTKDEVNITNGEALLIKRVGKVVLDGSESGWTDRPNYNSADRFVIGGFFPTNNKNILSNYFTKVNSLLDIYPYILNNDTQLIINFSEKGTTTLAQFKTWLSTHNVEVLYELAEPETINLGTVEMPHTYEGVSNITNSANTEMIVKYYKKFEFDKILRSGYNIDEQEYEIAKKQMANGKRKKILSSYVDCIIKIDLGLLDNKTYQEYKEQLEDGEYEYWSYKYNQYKKANFILTKPSITTEYAYDDDIGIDDMEITLEKSSDVS